LLVAGLWVTAAWGQEGPLAIVAFGDSTTAIRVTVEKVYAQRLPALLAHEGVAVQVVNQGIGGSHTGRLADNGTHPIQHALDRFKTAVLDRHPDIVIMQFGWNDSWVDSRKQGDDSRISLGQYKKNLDQMIRPLVKDGVIVVLMTPNGPRKGMEQWQVKRTARYATAVRELAGSYGLPLVDAWEAYQMYDAQDGQSSDSLLLDAVHPNDRGHQLVAEAIRDQVVTLIKNGLVRNGIIMQPRLRGKAWHELVRDGKNVGVYFSAAPWVSSEGHLESTTDSLLLAARSITEGDFYIQARLRMINQEASAASFFLGSNHFGFEGAKKTLYLNGPMFGGLKLLGSPNEFFKRDSWIDFEAIHAGDEFRFYVNKQLVHRVTSSLAEFDRFGFNAMRSTMQVKSLVFQGNSVARAATEPAAYTIPTIDLSTQKHRQVVVDREQGQYLGHPTTVLLEDNKTILCVYPKGHGRGAIVYKRSTDAGKTWSDRLPTPATWATSKEVPTIHRVIDAEGVKRLIMFSGLYPIRMAVSEDDGKTWSELSPIGDFGGIVTMGCVEGLKTGDGHYMALFHDDGRFFKGSGKASKFFVYKTLSTDGGLTWGEPEVIATHASAHLCEPGIIRSPNGRQLAVLLRENSRKHNSFVIFSKDEGKTWSTPRELPASLTGDRHTGKYGPDGRLFISFRDTTRVSPTKGDWVGWVGTYDDIIKGREGQYRVRLMDNHKGGDCAYPGVEVLPDGTFVTTTYGHWVAGEAPFIVSIRLKLSELDKMAK
jgi:lysophospholipase L1-like esterase